MFTKYDKYNVFITIIIIFCVCTNGWLIYSLSA